MTVLDQVLTDLAAEGDQLEGWVSGLADEQWRLATPAEGWDIATSVVHLAGAMGKPTWLLLPFVPDWRWMLGREDSPWYPTLRLFRQAQPGDWTATLARVGAALQERLASADAGALRR